MVRRGYKYDVRAASGRHYDDPHGSQKDGEELREEHREINKTSLAEGVSQEAEFHRDA